MEIRRNRTKVKTYPSKFAFCAFDQRRSSKFQKKSLSQLVNLMRIRKNEKLGVLSTRFYYIKLLKKISIHFWWYTSYYINPLSLESPAKILPPTYFTFSKDCKAFAFM